MYTQMETKSIMEQPSFKFDAEYVRQLEKVALDGWVDYVSGSARAWVELASLRASVSWRLTSPLRRIRGIQLKVREVGLRRGLRKGIEVMQRKAATRRHGG